MADNLHLDLGTTILAGVAFSIVPAIASAGVIILITSAGGAFGAMIRDELQGDTLSYAITRPVGRASYFLSKYLAQMAWYQAIAGVNLVLFILVGLFVEGCVAGFTVLRDPLSGTYPCPVGDCNRVICGIVTNF